MSESDTSTEYSGGNHADHQDSLGSDRSCGRGRTRGGGIGLVGATNPAGATSLVSITPCRVFDTRPEYQVGPKSSPLGAGETHTVKTHGDNGNCTGIPSTAVAISMNVTAVDATQGTFLAIWEAGVPRPAQASSLNPTPGAPPTPNAVTTDVNAQGEFSVYNLQGSVHVFADINGYYVDHNHDDRYYTKSAADDLFALRQPGASYQPHLLDYVPDIGSGWKLSTGWRHNAGSVESLAAPVNLADGSSNLEMTMTYQSVGAASVLVALVSMRTTAGPGASTDLLRRHIVDLNVPLTNTGGQMASITISDEPGDPYIGLSATGVPGDGWDTLMTVCTANTLLITSIRVDAG
jgi:hypothetical protein